MIEENNQIKKAYLEAYSKKSEYEPTKADEGQEGQDQAD